MRKELPHYHIENCIGGNQDWFRDLVMRVGGCAAVTACDLCIVMALNGYSDSLIPFDRNDLTREHFLEFGKIMKPYLHPRLSGITKLKVADYLPAILYAPFVSLLFHALGIG